MIPLTQSYSRKRNPIKRILIITILVGLAGSIFPEFTNEDTPFVLAVDDIVPWNVTLRITELGGAGNTNIFGEKPDALNGLDKYDFPEPPPPPRLPYIRSWFETSFPTPFTNLLQEYKSTASDRAVWNLSLVWVAAAGNQSTTTVHILWDPPQVNANHIHSLLLYENDVIVADMITNNSFSFSTNESLHRFQIMYEREISNGSGKPIELPVLPLVIGGIVCVVVIAIIFIVITRRTKMRASKRGSSKKKHVKK